MTFTGRLGSSDSRLGNIVLGAGSLRGRQYRRDARTPLYQLQAWEFDPNYGYGDMIAKFERFKNLGYADYLNNVPEAFFTLHQDDPKIGLLRNIGGRYHVRIFRNDELVWIGWGGMERDATSRDAIFYCYGYLSGLFTLHTDWKQSWTSATVGTIVSDMWSRAHNFADSRLAFVDTGQIDSPPTTAGGSTEIVLPTYEAYYKRLLFVMQEMAAISASDTGNSTAFEITTSNLPAFHFRTNIGQTLDTVRWEWAGGRGKIADFREHSSPVYHRNDILSVGQQPREVLLRKEVEDAADITEWGRLQESLFLAWVRDEDELTRVTNLRAAKAKREDMSLELDFHPGAETPPGTTQSRWRNGDIVPVKIDRGVTNIDANFQITGYLVSVLNGQEQVTAMIQEPVG